MYKRIAAISIGMIAVQVSGQVPAAVTGQNYVVDSGGTVGSLALSSGSDTCAWGAMLNGSGKIDGFSFTFDDSGTTYQLKGTVGSITDGVRSWQGYIDGVAASGTMVIYEDGDDVSIVVRDSSTQLRVWIRMDADDAELLPIDLSPTLARCVCFPPNSGGACTHSQCDSSEGCGSAGAGCQWRMTLE